MIDPIGTGWSRAANADDAKHFWSVHSDADAMAKVIALYVAHNDRAGSPKYLFGESYGGFRAAKVARALQRDQGIVTAGIVMLSPLLEGWLTFGDDGSALVRRWSCRRWQPPSWSARTSPRGAGRGRAIALTDYLTTLAGRPPQGEAAGVL